MADAALGTGAVAGQALAGAPVGGFRASGDERALRGQPGEGLVGGTGQEAAVQGDLARGEAEALELSGGLVEESVLGRVARRGGRRPAGSRARRGGCGR
ncbi:MAG: hypothetical protein LC790_15530 [Actinobacteria bacterium]|nr:hypothetical protein [Actinomycetota bacterium]